MTLMNYVDSRENSRGSRWEHSIFSVLFFYKLKTSLKNKVHLKHCKAQVRESNSIEGNLFHIKPVLDI